jgi:DNA-binding NtrC family response regulator
MRANAEVLILEDDVDTIDELKRHFASKRFHPLGARSASHAISMLENNSDSTRPVLAIVDWDLSKAPDGQWSSSDVLARLSRDLADCLVIVYSANIDSFRVRSEIHRAHPRAWLHDKRDGHDSLIARVDRVLDQTVGDLRVHDGSIVIHIPSLSEHHHREAVRLVVHFPDIVTLHSDTATKAVRRFGEWLTNHRSSVAVISHGNRKYRLGLVEREQSRDGVGAATGAAR